MQERPLYDTLILYYTIMLICPNCNAEFESGKFCKKCGTQLIDKTAGPAHCANCGAELEEGATFCGECGTKVQQQPQTCTCPKCGAEVKAGKKFCVSCGAKIEEVAEEVSQEDIIDEAINYINGDNPKRGFELLKQAERDGNTAAYYWLADCYYFGKGCDQNAKTAFKYFQKAADSGDADAYIELGICYFLGLGIQVNNPQAKKHFEMARDIAKDDGAFYWLGRVNYDTKNYREAVKCFKTAELKKDKRALYWLGIAYHSGNGVEKDEFKAFEYFNKSVDSGDNGSLFWLASFYENGTGCSQDAVKAFNLYKKGHESGDVYCTNDLGQCYYYGFGCPQDENYGLQLVRSAANNGVESAQKWLNEINNQSSNNNYSSSSSYSPSSSSNYNSSHNEIVNRVKSIIADKLGVDEYEITNNASFTNDLGADSLDAVELIMEFEKEFGVTIPDEQAERISTVGDAIAYIERCY